MKLKHCHNFHDFRKLAKKKIPSPVFHYIDGAADDEMTHIRNTKAFDDVDLVPNVLRDVSKIDLSTTVFGKKLDLPFYCSPTALQRLFHYDGEKAVGRAAAKFNTMFSVSTLSTTSMEVLAPIDAPKLFQYYYHKDKGLNDAMVEKAKEANFDVLALTVDTITSGNRERDFRTGFTSPPRITLSSAFSYVTKPMWGINYLTKAKFELPLLKDHVSELSNVATSIGDYFGNMLDQSMNWKDAEELKSKWGGQFALKGVMSVEDAKKAADIGCNGIIVSNHGGRQLDGSRSPFDHIAEIVDAVGDKIDVIMEGGIQRGTHILKALSVGAKACAGGRMYLYALAAAGQDGVEKALGIYRDELERDMKLMGCTKISDLSRQNLRYRN
ncbi:MAG: alpha-hydroxy-acid oxidizing enzyme [Chloroflexi bacterium]|nr:alpha-hydroxy-acid oxidizing enzyme [Chloroflexota bacterium]|tara:strand:+ start:11043 stop:12191 length:1149 start_codon:yes stop_codon:yes gene_type:complete